MHGRVVWSEVALSTAAGRLQDHCQVSAAGRHWISYSDNTDVWLLQIDPAEELGPPFAVNDVNLLTSDSALSRPAAVSATITDSTMANANHFQMASFQRLSTGNDVVAYKSIPVSGYYTDGTAVDLDWGSLVLAVYDPAMANALSPVEIHTAARDSLANRPHAARWRRDVFTSWDLGDATDYNPSDSNSHVEFIGAYVRIDRLEAEL